jgi:hypothetical protein
MYIHKAFYTNTHMFRQYVSSGRAGLLIVMYLAFLSGCTSEPETAMVKKEGYRPVYMPYEQMRQFSTTSPRPLEQAGKIYIRGNYVFVNEINKGIHIINNQNPASPQPVSFVSVPGNVDIAVKGNVLYADNAVDLLALDISNPTDVKLLKRIENAFPNQAFPPHTGVSFECADPARGVVVGWEKVQLENPKCFR